MQGGYHCHLVVKARDKTIHSAVISSAAKNNHVTQSGKKLQGYSIESKRDGNIRWLFIMRNRMIRKQYPCLPGKLWQVTNTSQVT